MVPGHRFQEKAGRQSSCDAGLDSHVRLQMTGEAPHGSSERRVCVVPAAERPASDAEIAGDERCDDLRPHRVETVSLRTRPGRTNALMELSFPVRVDAVGDRKSTRLNSSHLGISYAVFCLKKKINTHTI